MEIEEWPEPMKVYSQRVKELFGLPIPGMIQNGDTLIVKYSKGNSSFASSPYFIQPKDQAFSHLTTYRGLLGIINSGVIRLYNLHNSNDPNELFSLKGLPSYEHAAENLKPYTYTFSFFKSERVTNPAMWREYGQVSLNFEIINDPLKWMYYRISPIHYGDSDVVTKYRSLLEEMHKSFPPWRFQPDLESVLSLLAFHKEKQHEQEQEVRLLYVPHLFDDRDEAHFDFRVSHIRTGLTKYVELPLFVGDEAKPHLFRVGKHEPINDDSLPLIRVKSIEFGDNEPLFDQRQLNNLRFELEDYFTAKFGYQVTVKETLFETGVKSIVSKAP